MNIKIIPTITVEESRKYTEEITKLAFAPKLHIDIADGIFAPNKTVNFAQVYTNIGQNFDLHLMVEDPAKFLHEIVSLAPETVIFHAENFANNSDKFSEVHDFLAKFGIKSGVAILPKSAPENFAKIIENADEILIFGGHLGFQGGQADLKNLAKIHEIRELNPSAEISWDGGANEKNIREIVTAGVEKVNVGSAISRAKNPEEEYEKLVKIANAA